jgi:hypothetical protein
MSKANRITRLTSAACEQIQARMLEACRKIASDHGLVIESAGWRGLEPGFSFEPAFRISIPAPDGKPLNLDKEMFAPVGRTIRIGGRRLRTRVCRWR